MKVRVNEYKIQDAKTRRINKVHKSCSHGARRDRPDAFVADALARDPTQALRNVFRFQVVDFWLMTSLLG